MLLLLFFFWIWRKWNSNQELQATHMDNVIQTTKINGYVFYLSIELTSFKAGLGHSHIPTFWLAGKAGTSTVDGLRKDHQDMFGMLNHPNSNMPQMGTKYNPTCWMCETSKRDPAKENIPITTELRQGNKVCGLWNRYISQKSMFTLTKLHTAYRMVLPSYKLVYKRH